MSGILTSYIRIGSLHEWVRITEEQGYPNLLYMRGCHPISLYVDEMDVSAGRWRRVDESACRNIDKHVILK